MVKKLYDERYGVFEDWEITAVRDKYLTGLQRDEIIKEREGQQFKDDFERYRNVTHKISSGSTSSVSEKI